MINADEILMKKKGVTKKYKEEWGWTSYKVGEKMFAALCNPSEKYDKMYANHNILSLKCDTLEWELLKNKYDDVLPGFYLDKRFWISLRLDGDLSNEVIEELCEKAYQLVYEKLPKKVKA